MPSLGSVISRPSVRCGRRCRTRSEERSYVYLWLSLYSAPSASTRVRLILAGSYRCTGACCELSVACMRRASWNEDVDESSLQPVAVASHRLQRCRAETSWGFSRLQLNVWARRERGRAGVRSPQVRRMVGQAFRRPARPLRSFDILHWSCFRPAVPPEGRAADKLPTCRPELRRGGVNADPPTRDCACVLLSFFRDGNLCLLPGLRLGTALPLSILSACGSSGPLRLPLSAGTPEFDTADAFRAHVRAQIEADTGAPPFRDEKLRPTVRDVTPPRPPLAAARPPPQPLTARPSPHLGPPFPKAAEKDFRERMAAVQERAKANIAAVNEEVQRTRGGRRLSQDQINDAIQRVRTSTPSPVYPPRAHPWTRPRSLHGSTAPIATDSTHRCTAAHCDSARAAPPRRRTSRASS